MSLEESLPSMPHPSSKFISWRWQFASDWRATDPSEVLEIKFVNEVAMCVMIESAENVQVVIVHQSTGACNSHYGNFIRDWMCIPLIERKDME
jgi:hypothetical protein